MHVSCNSEMIECAPIIFLVFNRPELTRRVFERIREARPKRMLVCADGPRAASPDDELRCQEVRSIFDAIDWDCDVTYFFSSVNKGCARAVSEAVTYGLDLFGEAIILEDDCMPDPTFFTYCSALLDRYRDNDAVMCISGDNFQQGEIRGDSSYYFSKYPHCWGWATWRSAWRHFDLSMEGWQSYVQSPSFVELCPKTEEREFWSHLFQKCVDGGLHSWAIPWVYSCWRAGGRTALPNYNLVENIGFTCDATHTSESPNGVARSATPIKNIMHPTDLVIHLAADEFTFVHHFQLPRPTLTIYQEARMYLGAIKQRFVRRWGSPKVK
jgi:hypothetical protein